MKAILTVGISASGKTHWAEEFIRNRNDWVNINRDDVRFGYILGGVRDWSKYKFNKTNEEKVTNICNSQIDTAAFEDQNIIISDTNLNQKYREALIKKLEGLGYSVEIKVFDVDLEEAYRRDRLRPNSVGCEVIYRQWLQFQEFKGRKKYIPDLNLPIAVIVDIDGTVASGDGHRSPYDYSKVKDDKPLRQVIAIIHGLYLVGYKIVFVSGRDAICRKDTEEWLTLNVDIPFELFMRKEEDRRKDYIIKEELFWEHVAPKYAVDLVLDDRISVIENCWTPLGIKTLSCGRIHDRF